MKQINDYLHLYMSQQVIVTDSDGNDHLYTLDSEVYFKFKDQITQLALRPLSSMNFDEKNEFLHRELVLQKTSHEQSQWLISKGFDIFGLISDGIAIDSNPIILVGSVN